MIPSSATTPHPINPTFRHPRPELVRGGGGGIGGAEDGGGVWSFIGSGGCGVVWE
ncbi:MAG TPA: hypothetical protein VGX50_15525 [Longimicrobium sp.]|jgi:hypothetical protein|nr:hypothetical protein [Longimicrobium sp.]